MGSRGNFHLELFVRITFPFPVYVHCIDKLHCQNNMYLIFRYDGVNIYILGLDYEECSTQPVN